MMPRPQGGLWACVFVYHLSSVILSVRVFVCAPPVCVRFLGRRLTFSDSSPFVSTLSRAAAGNFPTYCPPSTPPETIIQL